MQGGYLSLFYSTSEKPLEYWSKQKSKTGSIRRVLDDILNENVLEIQDVEDSNSQKTWIMCPPDTQQVLNVELPFLVLVLRSTQTQCNFQLQIVDVNNVRHLINVANYEPKKLPNNKTPVSRLNLILKPGWNKLEIDLSHLSKILKTEFKELSRLRIYANCRIRRIYFADRHYNDSEISVGLYQGFLDYYMMKWGIKTVERATQTRQKLERTIGMRDNALHPTNGFSRLFLKSLQLKADRLVDEFFSRQMLKSGKEFNDFKMKSKIKPYVIPDISKFTKTFKTFNSSVIDLNEIRKTFVGENWWMPHANLNTKSKSKKKDFKIVNQDDKSSIHKIHKYRYPVTCEEKEENTKKIEKVSKSLVINKLKLQN